jgi:phosphate transport system substrate-binding protein
MIHASVQNRDGRFVQPDDATFQAAAANADWKHAPGFYQILTNQPGANAWPITGASFILMHARQDKPQNAAEVLKFFDWSFQNGRAMAQELDYVPLPDPVIVIVEDAWKAQIRDAAGKPVWAEAR